MLFLVCEVVLNWSFIGSGAGEVDHISKTMNENLKHLYLLQLVDSKEVRYFLSLNFKKSSFFYSNFIFKHKIRCFGLEKAENAHFLKNEPVMV